MSPLNASALRPAQVIVGSAFLFLMLVGCEAGKEPPVPAFPQACAAEAPTLKTPPIPREDFNGSYFGCANEFNLRAMLDNPADLNQGRPLGPANGERESAGVDDYEKRKTKSFDQATPAASITLTPSGPGASP